MYWSNLANELVFDELGFENGNLVVVVSNKGRHTLEGWVDINLFDRDRVQIGNAVVAINDLFICDDLKMIRQYDVIMGPLFP